MKLSVRNLTLAAATHTVVKNISFTLPQERALSIIGPSGSGKTSLLKGILGIAREFTRTGDIEFLDEDEPIRFGYIPQELALWPHLSVNQSLLLTCRFAKRSPQNLPQLMHDCGLHKLRHQKPATLSGGEKQRLALARALAQEPQILILDEPFAHLDVVAKTELIALINEQKARRGLSIIFVSHDLAETLAVGDMLMVMHQGEQIWFGNKEDLSSRIFMPEWNPLLSPLLSLHLST